MQALVDCQRSVTLTETQTHSILLASPFSVTHLGLQRAEENGETPCPAVSCGLGSNKQLAVMLFYEPLRRLNIPNEFAIEIVVQISILPLCSHSITMLIPENVRGRLPRRWV